MTINSSYSAEEFELNGTGPYQFTFEFIEANDVVVGLITKEGTVFILPTEEWSLTNFGAAVDRKYQGGTITLVSAPDTATYDGVIVGRSTSRTQLTDYVAGRPFPAATHEYNLDKITMILQEIDWSIGFQLPIDDGSGGPPSGSFVPNSFRMVAGAGMSQVGGPTMNGSEITFNIGQGLKGIEVGPNAISVNEQVAMRTEANLFREAQVFQKRILITTQEVSPDEPGIVMTNESGEGLTLWYADGAGTVANAVIGAPFAGNPPVQETSVFLIARESSVDTVKVWQFNPQGNLIFPQLPDDNNTLQPIDPTLPEHAVHKKYVDDLLENGVPPAGAVPEGRQVLAGVGLTGGGDLTADRTIRLGAGDGITASQDLTSVDSTVARRNASNSFEGQTTFLDLLRIRRSVNDTNGIVFYNNSNVGYGLLYAQNRGGGGANDVEMVLGSPLSNDFITNPIFEVVVLTRNGDPSTLKEFRFKPDGQLQLPDEPTQGSSAVNKFYVDNVVDGFVETTRRVDAGNGLTGGGALSQNVTININAGTGISVFADSIAVDSTVVRTNKSNTFQDLPNRFLGGVQMDDRLIMYRNPADERANIVMHGTTGASDQRYGLYVQQGQDPVGNILIDNELVITAPLAEDGSVTQNADVLLVTRARGVNSPFFFRFRRNGTLALPTNGNNTDEAVTRGYVDGVIAALQAQITALQAGGG